MFTRKPELDNIILEKLQNSFGEAILSHEIITDMLVLTVDKKIIPEIFSVLYHDDTLEFRFLTTLCGMHLPGEEKELGVVYHLHSFTNNHRIRLKSFTKLDEPHFPTLTSLFPTANWMERETFEFFGIIFEDHPNLKRILNVEDFEGFPLRKDFPLEDQTREDKDDSMFGR
ncbi:MAG: NADH-quinone oxidoreductase subunit C [Bacteroidales bacterium]